MLGDVCLFQITSPTGLLVVDLAVLDDGVSANHGGPRLVAELERMQVGVHHFIGALVRQLHSLALVDDVFGEDFVLECLCVLVAQAHVLRLEHLVVQTLVPAQIQCLIHA